VRAERLEADSNPAVTVGRPRASMALGYTLSPKHWSPFDGTQGYYLQCSKRCLRPVPRRYGVARMAGKTQNIKVLLVHT
jgi:hypothetical protein